GGPRVAGTGGPCRHTKRPAGAQRNTPGRWPGRGFLRNPAITYSRARRTTIGPGCLTAVFGMGTGVAIQVWSPERSAWTVVIRVVELGTRAKRRGTMRSSGRLLVPVS